MWKRDQFYPPRGNPLLLASPDLVAIRTLDPEIVIELRYSNTNNFAKRALYPREAHAYLHRPVAEALVRANNKLRSQGFRLKVWDAYRPFSVQEEMWKLAPGTAYVAEPVRRNGSLVQGSVHNRGAAVDVTLVDKDGNELEMPTPFDDFSQRAHRNNTACSAIAMRNRTLLENAMVQFGFVGLPTGWWHFDWKDAGKFPLLDIPFTVYKE